MPRPATIARGRAASGAAGILAALLATPKPARAAPDDGFSLSSDATLAGGTAIALGRDAASVWFNPAAAASLDRVRLDAAVAAYGVRRTRARVAMQARRDGGSLRTGGVERHGFVVPAAAAFGFRLPRSRLGLALSLHNPVYADLEARVRLRGRSEGGGYDFVQEVNSLAIRRRYHGGITLGWRANDRFRIGASLNGVWDKNITFSRFVVSAGGGEGPASASLVGGEDVATRVGGIELVLGLRGELTPRLTAGATIRSPAVVVFRRFAGGQSFASTLVDPSGEVATQTNTDPGIVENPPRWLSPWQVSAGLAYSFARGNLALDAEGAPGRSSEVGEVWRSAPVWNVRLGATRHLTPRWSLGGGVFTDRSNRPEAGLFPAAVVDRWGGSFGARLRNPVRLGPYERSDSLVFETTVAVRYAFGVGSAQRLTVSYPDAGPHLVTIETLDRTPVTQHLLVLHVGTALRF